MGLKGTFLGYEKVLYVDFGGGYMSYISVYIYQNLPNSTFKMVKF